MEIANFFWEGELTKFEKSCIKSFIDNGFEVNLWSYNGLVVDGAKSCDAKKLLKQDNLDKKIIDINYNITFASKSDFFRYLVVEYTNGWWFDCDCYCLKNQLEFKKLRENKNIVVGKESDIHINGAVLYAKKNIARKMINSSFKLQNEFSNEEELVWGFYGPLFITNFIEENNLTNEVEAIDSFYAISYKMLDWFVNPKLLKSANEILKNSYLCHLWKTSFILDGIDFENPKDGSLLNEFYKNLDK